MRLIRKTPRVEKNFSRSLIRVGVGIRIFVLEYVALLGGVMMGPEWASLIKVLSAQWHSSCSRGLLFLFLLAMNSFRWCQNLKKKKKIPRTKTGQQ